MESSVTRVQEKYVSSCDEFAAENPTAGEVIVNQTNLSQLSQRIAKKERKAIGMIFQHFNLMESRTIFDNVDFSLKYSGKSKQERRQKVNELLELVGLEEKSICLS